REPATIMTAIGKDDRWHLELKWRWVDQYNFYVQDSRWGQMFVRVCPYFPFSARVCLNQHYWLALRMRERGIRFQQCANAFLQCSDPETLQKLADSLTADDLLTCAQKWLTPSRPFSLPRRESTPAFSTGCFLRRWSSATISSFVVVLPSMPSSNGSSTPIAPSVNPTNSP